MCRDPKEKHLLPMLCVISALTGLLLVAGCDSFSERAPVSFIEPPAQEAVATLAMSPLAVAIPDTKEQIPPLPPPHSNATKQPLQGKCSLLMEKNGFNFWASFLYWQAQQDYMDVALAAPSVKSNSCCGFSYRNGDVIEINGDFHPGFKMGGSFEFRETEWKILTDYTFFKSSASKSAETTRDGFLFVKWIQPNLISNNASSRMEAHWNLEMNVLNTQVGKSFLFTNTLSLMPYWGIATAWLNQKFSNHLELLFPKIHLHVFDHSESFRIGPRMGLSATYDFLSPFGISANLAGEILYSHYKLSTKQKSSTDSSVVMSASNTLSRVNPEIEMYAGIYYRSCFARQTQYLKVELGYDFQVFWNQNMMRWYNDITYTATPIGNLYFQGLRASLSFGF